MKKHWSRSYSPRNTRLLRSLLKSGRVVADPINGVVLRRNGKPFATVVNYCGYLRFRVQIVRRGKGINAWFFAHKAIFFSTNPTLRKFWEVDHLDGDTTNNRLSNLEYKHRKLNAARKYQDDTKPAF